MVFGIVLYDPITAGLAAVCLTVLAAAASFVPAARIARLEPARILREE